MVGLTLTTLRLYRAQILATMVLVVALLLLAVSTGMLAAAAIDSSVAGGCEPVDCAAAVARAEQSYPLFTQVLPFLTLLPAVVGAFWGAPLVAREYDSGTVKLAWTQSVSRRTWTLGRMAVLGVIVAICGSAVGGAVSFWISVFDGYGAFDGSGEVYPFSQIRGWGPLGWWLFAFAVGALCGALLRRTVVAMAVTAAVLVGVTILRNLLFGKMAENLSVMTELQVQRIEVVTLVLLSVLLSVATDWIVQRARV